MFLKAFGHDAHCVHLPGAIARKMLGYQIPNAHRWPSSVSAHFRHSEFRIDPY